MTKPSHTLALEEMRLEYQQVSQSSDVLDNKASAMLGASSLILGLLGVLQISAASRSLTIQIGLGIAAALYFVMVWLCLKSIFPKSFTTPIQADWNVLSKYLLTQKEKDAVLNILSGYVTQIQHNKHINEIKARNVQAVQWIFTVIILLLLLLSIFG